MSSAIEKKKVALVISAYLATQTDGFFDTNTRLVPQNLLSFDSTSIPSGTCILYTPTAESCHCSHQPGDRLTRQPGEVSQTLWDMHFKRGDVPKMCPDCQTKITEDDRFVILNEKGLACSGAGR